MAIGKVIKGETMEPLPERAPQGRPRANIMGAETFEANQQAREILAAANREAEKIRADAQAQAQALHKQAIREGFEKGRAQATAELVKAKQQAGQILQASERDILALALTMTAKIIGQDLERDPLVLGQMCATAVETARSAKALVVRIHPAQRARLREQDAAFAAVLGKLFDVTLREDPDVEPQGCIIQTEFGTIDAQLKTQLEMLRNVLLPDTGKAEPKD
jgi:type III secretion protein L